VERKGKVYFYSRAAGASHLLEQRDLSSMIQLVLRHAMKHVVESVMGSLLARDLLVKPRVWENRNGLDQFLVDAPHLGQRLAPCRLARVRDRRKILCVGESHRDPIQPAQHCAIPGRDMQHQLPDRVGALKRTSRRLRGRNALQNFKQ